MIVVDFETRPITNVCAVPEPVGVAILDTRLRRRSRYYHWGHWPASVSRPPDWHRPWVRAEYTAFTEVCAMLRDIWRGDQDLLFHNASYDLRVAREYMGLAYPEWQRIHDTVWDAFLLYPNNATLSLKPLAEQFLGEEPSERDLMHEWLKVNKVSRTPELRELGVPTVDRAPAAYTCNAPPYIVGRYACGDVDRTWDLYALLHQEVLDLRMSAAYERYQRVCPVLCKMSDRGFALDKRTVRDARGVLRVAQERVTRYLDRRMGAGVRGSPKRLVAWLTERKLMSADWELYRTPKGAFSASAAALDRCCTDRALVGALRYAKQADFYLSTFLDRWAGRSRVQPTWDQTRHHDPLGRRHGARTGRVASHPNVQNIPKPGKVPKFSHLKRDGVNLLPRALKDLPQLPNLRACIVASKGCRFVDADYSQQELRILAHYEDGELKAAFRANPELDMHTFIQDSVQRLTGVRYQRAHVKSVAFGILYGSGQAKQAEQLGLDPRLQESLDKVREIKSAYLRAMPGVDSLIRDFKNNPARHATDPEALGASSAQSLWGPGIERDPLYTIGGRVCWVESPNVDADGEVLRTYEYKLLNTVIQGSAGDQLLEALVQLDDAGYAVVLTAHDQVIVEVSREGGRVHRREIQRILEVDVPRALTRPARGAQIPFDVPMLVDCKTTKRWGE